MIQKATELGITKFMPIIFERTIVRKVNTERLKSNNLEFLFDDVFSVEEVGIYKPDPKVYDLPIKRYSIKKEEVLFLSSNTWDVSGGGNYGYNSIWINRNDNIFDILDFTPKFEINNLSNLISILK
mgnify:CR=1 FL=1